MCVDEGIRLLYPLRLLFMGQSLTVFEYCDKELIFCLTASRDDGDDVNLPDNSMNNLLALDRYIVSSGMSRRGAVWYNMFRKF